MSCFVLFSCAAVAVAVAVVVGLLVFFLPVLKVRWENSNSNLCALCFNILHLNNTMTACNISFSLALLCLTFYFLFFCFTRQKIQFNTTDVSYCSNFPVQLNGKFIEFFLFKLQYLTSKPERRRVPHYNTTNTIQHSNFSK